MSASEWVVLAAGVTAIAWVNWYFFIADRGTAVATAVARGGAAGSGELAGADGRTTSSETASSSAIPSVTITVKGGYSPGTVRATAGQPVRLVFDRQEASSCSEEVVFPDFGIRKFLAPFQQTAVEVTPPEPGTYEFTCGMSMLRGTLIAE